MDGKEQLEVKKSVSIWWNTQTPDMKRLEIIVIICCLISVLVEFIFFRRGKSFSEALLEGMMLGTFWGSILFAAVTSVLRLISNAKK